MFVGSCIEAMCSRSRKIFSLVLCYAALVEALSTCFKCVGRHLEHYVLRDLNPRKSFCFDRIMKRFHVYRFQAEN